MNFEWALKKYMYFILRDWNEYKKPMKVAKTTSVVVTVQKNY